MSGSEPLREALEGLGPGFELVGELGRGATAVVYRVRDHDLGRDLALKVIRSTFLEDEEALGRLEREARLVARLQHPNIVQLYGTRQLSDGSLVLIMEHVPGRNLKEIVRASGPMSVRRTLSVLRDVASGLAFAHRRRIVHRDVKPENIYVNEEVGTARLADFGVARPWDQASGLTLPGGSLGTPAYMSPEQVEGVEVDGRSDVYSLGLVGYEMLAGEHPWEGDNLYSLIYKQKSEPLPPLDVVRRDVPAFLATTLEKALHKDPAQRWSSAEPMLRALSREEEPSEVYPVALELEPTPAGAAPVAPLPHAEAEPAGASAGALRSDEPAPPLVLRTRDRGTMWLSLGAAALVLLLGAGATWWFRTALAGDGAGSGRSALEAAPSVPAPAAALADSGPPPATGTLAVEVVGETERVAWTGQAPDLPLAVRVRGPDGQPLPGVPVRFEVEEGAATLDRAEVRTDEAGLALAGPLVGFTPGTVTVRARVDTLADTVDGTPPDGVVFRTVFRPAARVVASGGSGQTAAPGRPLESPLAVRVLDGAGEPVSGTEVVFRTGEDEGRVAPTRVRTDGSGWARARWTLGPDEGSQAAVASVPLVGDTTIFFRATARAEPEPRPTAEAPTSTPAPAVESVRPERTFFAVGGTHACTVDGGDISCRGAIGGPSPGPAEPVLVAGGISHACALTADGTAWCWGENGAGQLGDGTSTDRPEGVELSAAPAFSELALGLTHSCGLDASGSAHCWGGNASGQLGTGGRDDSPRPREVAAEVAFQELAAGWNHTCGLDGEGRAWCWGLNDAGQLGDATRVDRTSPVAVSGGRRFAGLAAGSAHTCGWTAGSVLCWGGNAAGQLGDGTTASRDRPAPVEQLPSGAVVDVAVGAVHTCAVFEDGGLWCWGQNVHGQLGDGTTTSRSLPARVPGSYVSVSAGGGTTCARSTGGERLCWGLNQSGQVGDGTRTNRVRPTPAGGDPSP